MIIAVIFLQARCPSCWQTNRIRASRGCLYLVSESYKWLIVTLTFVWESYCCYHCVFTEPSQWHSVKAGFCVVVIRAHYQHRSSAYLSTIVFIVVTGWVPAAACGTAGTQPTCIAAAWVVNAARSLWTSVWSSSAVYHRPNQCVL